MTTEEAISILRLSRRSDTPKEFDGVAIKPGIPLPYGLGETVEIEWRKGNERWKKLVCVESFAMDERSQ
ncbi:MAG: hypothetical protein FWG40_00740 [Peptococcaceae bacterium]|nr:hypothetical protein [Peptococcaceae bacterium]